MIKKVLSVFLLMSLAVLSIGVFKEREEVSAQEFQEIYDWTDFRTMESNNSYILKNDLDKNTAGFSSGYRGSSPDAAPENVVLDGNDKTIKDFVGPLFEITISNYTITDLTIIPGDLLTEDGTNALPSISFVTGIFHEVKNSVFENVTFKGATIHFGGFQHAMNNDAIESEGFFMIGKAENTDFKNLKMIDMSFPDYVDGSWDGASSFSGAIFGDVSGIVNIDGLLLEGNRWMISDIANGDTNSTAPVAFSPVINTLQAAELNINNFVSKNNEISFRLIGANSIGGSSGYSSFAVGQIIDSDLKITNYYLKDNYLSAERLGSGLFVGSYGALNFGNVLGRKLGNSDYFSKYGYSIRNGINNGTREIGSRTPGSQEFIEAFGETSLNFGHRNFWSSKEVGSYDGVGGYNSQLLFISDGENQDDDLIDFYNTNHNDSDLVSTEGLTFVFGDTRLAKADHSRFILTSQLKDEDFLKGQKDFDFNECWTFADDNDGFPVLTIEGYETIKEMPQTLELTSSDFDNSGEFEYFVYNGFQPPSGEEGQFIFDLTYFYGADQFDSDPNEPWRSEEEFDDGQPYWFYDWSNKQLYVLEYLAVSGEKQALQYNYFDDSSVLLKRYNADYKQDIEFAWAGFADSLNFENVRFSIEFENGENYEETPTGEIDSFTRYVDVENEQLFRYDIYLKWTDTGGEEQSFLLFPDNVFLGGAGKDYIDALGTAREQKSVGLINVEGTGEGITMGRNYINNEDIPYYNTTSSSAFVFVTDHTEDGNNEEMIVWNETDEQREIKIRSFVYDKIYGSGWTRNQGTSGTNDATEYGYALYPVEGLSQNKVYTASYSHMTGTVGSSNILATQSSSLLDYNLENSYNRGDVLKFEATATTQIFNFFEQQSIFEESYTNTTRNADISNTTSYNTSVQLYNENNPDGGIGSVYFDLYSTTHMSDAPSYLISVSDSFSITDRDIQGAVDGYFENVGLSPQIVPFALMMLIGIVSFIMMALGVSKIISIMVGVSMIGIGYFFGLIPGWFILLIVISLLLLFFFVGKIGNTGGKGDE